jgi:uncharacterized membrane protein (DUF373 family)
MYAGNDMMATSQYSSIQAEIAEAPSRTGRVTTYLNRRLLERMQDVIVVALVLVLFALMIRTLWRMVEDVTGPKLDFRIVISEVLFMLVMVELVRLLLVYLREHHVAVDSMVEVGIVSTLREMVLYGVVELAWQRIVAIALRLLALGALLRFGDLRFQLNGIKIDPHMGSISDEASNAE